MHKDKGTPRRYAGEEECPDEREELASPAPRIPLRSASSSLRAALERSDLDHCGMRSARAVDANGMRITAGLFGDEVLLMRLPWPNPHGIAERLDHEPPGLQWRAYQERSEPRER